MLENTPDLELEPERYELFAGPAYQFTPDRREFLKVLGGGILVLLALDAAELEAQESGGARRGGRGGGGDLPQNLGAWLHIRPDGKIVAYTGKVEVGQNARTSLTMAIAEELRVSPGDVEFVMGDTKLVPYDMGTFGSQTTPRMAPQIHKVAATAREMLLDLAAKQWSADRATLTLDGGRVRNPNGKSLSFAELSQGQKLARTVTSATTTPASEWKTLGHSLTKVNARDIVTGKHRFTHDVTRPGMLYGRIVRPPAYGAQLQSANVEAAQKIAGVTVVRDGQFLGVASADSTKLAQAIAALDARWTTPTAATNSRDLYGYLRSHTQNAADPSAKIDATYNIAYIAHTPLETRAAVAEWEGGKLTVWTGSQRPFGVRDELAQAFQIPATDVRVLIPDTGSGYGGKHTGEAAIEAARLARAAGKPVKVAWSREEEFMWAYFRPAGVIDIASRTTPDGAIVEWVFDNYNSGNAGLESPYNIPGQKSRFHGAESPLRQGSYRGLAATANHFARECYMDELARKLGLDPLDFRLKNANNPRLRAVIQAAAEKFNWSGSKMPANHGKGIAAGFDKGGYIGCCAEVAVDPVSKQVRVIRTATSFECGAIRNPDQLRNQIEGAVMMGIGGALLEAIEFENGRILNPVLSKYRVPRFSDTPVIDVVLIDRKDLASAGAGETGIVGIAPAIGNAIFHATGQRVRSLPMKLV